MFGKILIANRGEIALRIIRSCKEMGMKTVAVYSTADRDSLPVLFADEAVCIGPPPAKDSYLNIPAIISAVEITAADAIHPGYGFLAENPHFAEVCEELKVKFIGPPSKAISQMGDKAVAKQIMKRAGVPVIPGSDGAVKDVEEAKAVAREVGYPVIIKASAGGGGKGMRIARDEDELIKLLHIAQNEAEAAFGDPQVYIEKFIEEPKHIEVQILADSHGNIIHLGERDCSVQRRHQKLIEEAPSPAVDEALRQRMGRIAVKAAQAVGYENAGTVEFIMDKDKNFYFMEMNTRIQVEHPVTELVTGVDIVKQQILIAAGEKLGIKQREVKIKGHAIECRINAEDPDRDFMPSPGKITDYHPPGGLGVRLDSHIFSGYEVPPYYDSILAKLIVHADTREEAICRMRRALEEYVIGGVKTTIPFHKRVLENGYFKAGEVFTNFIETKLFEKEG